MANISVNSAWPSLTGSRIKYTSKSRDVEGTPRDVLAPYPWPRSVNWCPAESWGNGDQHRAMGLTAWEGLYVLRAMLAMDRVERKPACYWVLHYTHCAVQLALVMGRE